MKTGADLLQGFESVPLSAISGVSLTNRFETKFILNSVSLPSLLKDLKETYWVIHSASGETTDYTTRYYDNPAFKLYLDHHNRRAERFKVRQRTYMDSGKTWLELKFGTGAGRVMKERTRRDTNESSLKGTELDFLAVRLPFHPGELLSTVMSQYTRITLLNKTDQERVTIDTGLRFSNEDRAHSCENLVIVEIKSISGQSSPAHLALKKMGSRPLALSKYCLGINYLYPSLKKNNFNARLRAITKLTA